MCQLLVALCHTEAALACRPLRSQVPTPECGETEAKFQDKEAPQGQERPESGASGRRPLPATHGSMVSSRSLCLALSLGDPIWDTAEPLTSPEQSVKSQSKEPRGRPEGPLSSAAVTVMEGAHQPFPSGLSPSWDPQASRPAPHPLPGPQPCSKAKRQVGACCHLNVCCPPKSICCNRPPKVTGSGGDAFGRW